MLRNSREASATLTPSGLNFPDHSTREYFPSTVCVGQSVPFAVDGQRCVDSDQPLLAHLAPEVPGIVLFNAAWSSAIRSGRLAPGMTAAEAGCASENCNAAALKGT